MIQKIKNLILAVALPLALAVPALAPIPASAACNAQGQSIANGASTAATGQEGSIDCNAVSGGISQTGIGTLAKNVVDWLSWAIGIISIIMIIFAGFKYITSGGESSNVSGAKNTLIYAIVGLVLVVLAQVIVKVVLSGVSNVN